MQPQELHGLAWPENEASMPPLPTVKTHGDLHLGMSSSLGNEPELEVNPRRHRLNKVRVEIHDSRDQVARNRLELRELRVELQQLGARIWQMQDQFWRDMHNQGNHPTTVKSSKELHDQIQRSLDEIGPKQASYDEKEDSLIFLEYQLGKQEKRLYNLDSRLVESLAVALKDSSSDSSSPRSHSTIQQFTEDETSLAHRYLSRIGDANIVKERLLELTEERAQYLALERDRAAMGLQLYQSNVDFLANFDDVYTNHLNELREIDEDIQNLEPRTGLLPLDDLDIQPYDEAHSQPRATPLRAQSDLPKGTVHESIRRRKSDGDLIYLPVDRRSAHHRLSQWIPESLGAPVMEGTQPQALLDRSWWRSVQEHWQEDQDIPSSQSPLGETSKLSVSASSRDRRGAKSGLTLNEGQEELENFFDYPLATVDPSGDTALDVSWKPRAMGDSFDMCLSIQSAFDEEDFAFHDGSERSARF